MSDDQGSSWEPTRIELLKWKTKNALGAALFLGVAGLGAILYLAAITALFHFCGLDSHHYRR
jgi:hypothetical protein